MAIAFTIRLRNAARRARAVEAAEIDAARALQDARAQQGQPLSYAEVVHSPNKRRHSSSGSSCGSAASAMLASAGSSDADPSDLVGFVVKLWVLLSECSIVSVGQRLTLGR